MLVWTFLNCNERKKICWNYIYCWCFHRWIMNLSPSLHLLELKSPLTRLETMSKYKPTLAWEFCMTPNTTQKSMYPPAIKAACVACVATTMATKWMTSCCPMAHKAPVSVHSDRHGHCQPPVLSVEMKVPLSSAIKPKPRDTAEVTPVDSWQLPLVPSVPVMIEWILSNMWLTVYLTCVLWMETERCCVKIFRLMPSSASKPRYKSCHGEIVHSAVSF